MNYYRRKRNLLQSWLLLGCLFFLTAIIPRVLASSSIRTIQAAANPQQIIIQAQKLDRAGDFKAAIPLWQKAAADFQPLGDLQNEAMALSNLSLTYQQLGQWEAARDAIA